MNRGLYTAASGMLINLMRQETIVHNLANARTTGYKADKMTATDFPSLLLTQVNGSAPGPEVGEAGLGITMSSLTTDFSSGPMKLTDHPFDLAVAGEGFFQLQTPDGVRYTRDGRFSRDVNGLLLNANGYAVLGTGGPITLPEGQPTISPSGSVFVDGEQVAQISLAAIEDTAQLTKEGETMFAAAGDNAVQVLPPEETKIYQGYLEDSNVDTTQMVTEMMTVLRAYQFSQKMVQYQDRILGRTVSEIGRV